MNDEEKLEDRVQKLDERIEEVELVCEGLQIAIQTLTKTITDCAARANQIQQLVESLDVPRRSPPSEN